MVSFPPMNKYEIDSQGALWYHLRSIGVNLMFKNKNKFLLCLLFLAALSFIFFSVGGESLHSQIHHHQDQASHGQCFIYQIQIQTFIAVSAIVIAFLIELNGCVTTACQSIIIKFYQSLINPRAPPIIS